MKACMHKAHIGKPKITALSTPQIQSMEEVPFLLSKPYTSPRILNSTPPKPLLFSAQNYTHLSLALSHLRAKNKHPLINIHSFLATVPLALHNILSPLNSLEPASAYTAALELLLLLSLDANTHSAALVLPSVTSSSTSSARGPYPPWSPSTYQPPPFGCSPGTPSNICDAETAPNMFLLVMASFSFSLLLLHHPDNPEILPPKSYRSRLSSSLSRAVIIPHRDYNINLLTGLPAPAPVSALFSPFSILMQSDLSTTFVYLNSPSTSPSLPG